jgi:hypothetical protein
MKAYGEWMYRSTFSWPRQKLEVSGQLHAPAALTPGKEPPVPIEQEVRWTSEPVWTIWRSENSWSHRDSNSDSSVVQPVVSRYTDYVIPAPRKIYYLMNFIHSFAEHRIAKVSTNLK